MWYLKEMFWTLTYYHSTYDSKSKSNTKTGGLEASLNGRCPLSVFTFKIEGVHQPVEKKLFVSATFTVLIFKKAVHIQWCYWFSCTIWTELSWMMILTWQHRCCYCTESESSRIMALLSFYSCFFSVWSQNTEAHVYLFTYLFLENVFSAISWHNNPCIFTVNMKLPWNINKCDFYN